MGTVLHPLPDFYLNMPIFLDGVLYDESYALIDSIMKSLDLLMEIVTFQDGILAETITVSGEKRLDMIVELMDSQFDAIEKSSCLILQQAYIDVLVCNRTLFTEHCLGAVSRIDIVLARASDQIQYASYDMLRRVVFPWTRNECRMIAVKGVLQHACCEFYQLSSEMKYKRADQLLRSLMLNGDSHSIALDQYRIRRVSELVCHDHALSPEQRSYLAQKVLESVKVTTLATCISRCEFYSLYLIVLSDDIAPVTQIAAHDILQRKWQAKTVPMATRDKIGYYLVFFELLDLFYVEGGKKKHALENMLSKIEHDLDGSDVQGSDDLRVVYALMQIRLEFFYYNVLDGAEKIDVCEKLLKKLSIQTHNASEAIVRCLLKMRLVVYMDMLVARWSNELPQRSSGFVLGLFTQSEPSRERAPEYQHAVESIWRSASSRDDLQLLFNKMQNGYFSDKSSLFSYFTSGHTVDLDAQMDTHQTRI